MLSDLLDNQLNMLTLAVNLGYITRIEFRDGCIIRLITNDGYLNLELSLAVMKSLTNDNVTRFNQKGREE